MNIFQDKINILKKWYHLYQGDLLDDNNHQFNNIYSEGLYHNNNDNDINNYNDDDNNNNININDSEKDYLSNQEENELSKISGAQIQNKYKREEEEELNISRFHYSLPNYNIITNNDFMDPRNNKKMFSTDMKKRDINSGCNNVNNEYCEKTCINNKGEPFILNDLYAPMYNCSGRYLTNVYDISKLPLQHCSTCLETNVTCLSWCCELMDTSVNNEIPETIEVEEIVNGTAVNTTALNPELNKVCYCPIDKYGMNCQSFYNAQCILEILSPNMDCYSNDGQKLKGLQYYDKENNCPLYNYTDIINMEYKLNCTQVLSAAYNLSLATNNFTFNNNYLIKQPSYYVSTTRGVSFTTRIWNFNHLGHSIDISMPINYSQITGNETIKVQLDLGKYYLPDEKMRSIYNGGRITVQSGFAYGSSVNGGGIPKSVVTYINIKNYFKNTEFFDKEVKLKTIKQILTIVIPIVVGCILLLILCLFIVYMLYKKSKPMKISC